MDDTKRVIDLEKAREELEQSKQAVDNMTFEELTNDNITKINNVLERLMNTQERLISLAEYQQELYSGTMQAIGKLESDLMEQGIFVGSYNLDDID